MDGRHSNADGAIPAAMRQQSIAVAGNETPVSGPLTLRGISVVLPAYNEEAVIEQTVTTCADVLSALAPDYEVIVVDDGSRDRTGEIADQLAMRNPRVRVIHNRPNRGYGGALMAGFAAASKPLSFFMDSDGQFDIRDIAALITLREQGYRVVLGYRKHRRDAFMRKINAWGWNRLGRVLFGLRIHDVDCAFKLFDTSLVRVCDVRAEGAMVNTELLVKLKKLGVPYIETPVNHYPRQHGSATGANLKVISRAFRELMKLHGKIKSWDAELPPEV
ncbi:MAG TPA: glycosyltransferase family 2 protein [Ktedonobacterales bacterium]|nr:glycosyltransferase family 2 protein [Ktedonobacterales bacterium]